MVFERFVSDARDEPPDIDVDFEHERREEVIQYIYRRFGRERAGICATVIHYRGKRAIREVGAAMGLSRDTVAALSSPDLGLGRRRAAARAAGRARARPRRAAAALTMELVDEIVGFPRHLSQHVGGFVITEGRLDELVPIENAAMEDRTVICWDKDDIDTLGILKVDVLALGHAHLHPQGAASCSPSTAASATRWRACRPRTRRSTTCSAAPTRSASSRWRAGRSSRFLPRMKPRAFYDLVIEVAIVRPGPIQGGMVHPYLRRRRGEEPIDYAEDHPLGAVLKRTLGVPLFQEQAMQIAIVGADFTPDEADRLRRALGTFKGDGTVYRFRERFLAGMAANGYDADFAERCFGQIEGFGSYGFPESHAASFALLVYASAWIKCHHPAIFACALLNSQPMGFYAPAQIVRDAREHGVEVRPVCINAERLGQHASSQTARLRLGFRQVKGVGEGDAEWITAARGNGYRDVAAVWRRAGVSRRLLELLVERRRLRRPRAQPPRGALAGAGDRRRAAAAALRRGREAGGGAGRRCRR